jgi:hypothetical protein
MAVKSPLNFATKRRLAAGAGHASKNGSHYKFGFYRVGGAATGFAAAKKVGGGVAKLLTERKNCGKIRPRWSTPAIARRIDSVTRRRELRLEEQGRGYFAFAFH